MVGDDGGQLPGGRIEELEAAVTRVHDLAMVAPPAATPIAHRRDVVQHPAMLGAGR
ncbi:hypothetical protein QZN11_27740 [Streptomyces gramineus]|uniref:hypothetical protein n=1 Tax=Streptomyces gramineus TaxID=910542 RepID=UPI00398B4DDB